MAKVKDTDCDCDTFPDSTDQRVNMLPEESDDFEDEHCTEGVQNGKHNNV